MIKVKPLHYKGYVVRIEPKGQQGYQVTVTRNGFRPVVSAQNFSDPIKAGVVIKRAIDEGQIPQERVGLLAGLIKTLLRT